MAVQYRLGLLSCGRNWPYSFDRAAPCAARADLATVTKLKSYNLTKVINLRGNGRALLLIDCEKKSIINTRSDFLTF